MKKVLKLVCLTLVFSMLFSLTAFAAEITVSTPEVDVENMTASVKVTVADSVDDQQVVILVLANGAKLGDASISDDDIAYIDQAAAVSTGTDGEKEFTFNFGINTVKFSGTSYTAYIGGTDVTTATPKNLRFAEGGPGDCNADDSVNSLDYEILSEAWGTVPGDEKYDERANMSPDDSGINALDFEVLSYNYGNYYGG